MHAVNAPLPEFEPMRHQEKPAPMMRPDRFNFGELGANWPELPHDAADTTTPAKAEVMIL
jgi:hypothetical protein